MLHTAQKSRPAIMRHFSTLAGSLQKLPRNAPYRVQYIELMQFDTFVYRHWTRIVSYGALLFTVGLAVVLFYPDHWIVNRQPDSALTPFNWLMLGCLILLQTFVITGTFAATRSTVRARNPLPVRPPARLRIAFATTRAPSEPVEMVESTLTAMKQVQYKQGLVDIWLLDETKDAELQKICKKLGVNYFSRKGIAAWNTQKPERHFWRSVITFGRKSSAKKRKDPNPFLATRTKHGNFNAWLSHLKRKKISYDILAGVDADHSPEPNYLQRMLGYFRDEDVAFVVGPQVYGNYRSGLDGLVTRWAESQASFFQSTVQRAGNASGSPMFVGTNYAVRMPVLDQINGFQPCITEDMATGLVIHTRRNPATGKRWKSVYTPDVLAVGEGPDMWAPYFTQQWRWAAGTFDTWFRVVWKLFYKLSPKAMIHYFMMLTFYPITALTWLLGIISTMTYLLTGATAIIAPWSEFVSLYLISLTMQLSLYFWNRRFNVSPHEPTGSLGVAGMVLTSLTAPIYLSAFFGMAIGKKVHFEVTSKGTHERSYDPIKAFRIHLLWAGVIIGGLAYGFTHGHAHMAMWIWAVAQLIICLLPVALGWAAWLPTRYRKKLSTKKPLTAGEIV